MSLDKLKITIDKIKKASVKNDLNDSSINKLKRVIENIKTSTFDNNNSLEEIITRIRESFIENWESDNMNFVSRITNQLKLDEGIPLPILSICGKGTREIRFTEYLSFFLNPDNNHGLKDEFLKAMFNKECRQNGLNSNWYKNCEIITEYNIGTIPINDKEINCYGDICIIGENFMIIIEHKILSPESDHPETDLKQLERYNLALCSNKKLSDKDLVKLYLAPETRVSMENQDWISITHKEIVERGILLLNEKEFSSIARENLLRLLIDLSVGPYQLFDDSLETMVILGEKLKNETFNLYNALQFERLATQNEQILKLLLEV